VTTGVTGSAEIDGSSPTPDIAPAAKNSASVAIWTLVSRATGLVRVVVLAAVLGPTFFGNIVQTTNLLPYFVYNILAGSMLSALLVPPLVAALDRHDRASAERLIGGFLGSILAVGAAIGFAVVLAGPLLSRPMVVAIDAADREAAIRVATALIVMVVPQVLLLAVAGAGLAAQNSCGRFALAAAASIFENVGIIVTLSLSAILFGTGVEVSEVSNAQLALLITGLTGSVGVHAAAQWLGAWRAGLMIRPRFGLFDPEVRAVLRLLPATIGSTALTAGRYLALSIVAGTVPGGVSAVQVALSFYNLPVALGSVPISTALLPHLSRVASSDDRREFAAVYDTGLRLAWFLSVPASIALIVLATPIADAIALGAMDEPQAIDLIGVALTAVAFAVIGEASLEVSRRTSYALRNARLPLDAMLIRAAITVAGLTIAWTLDGVSTIFAVGMTVAAGDLISAGWLDRSLRHVVGVKPLTPPLSYLGRNMAISALMAVPAIGVPQIVLRLVDTSFAPLLALGAASVLGLGLYLAVHRWAGSSELDVFADLVSTWRPRPASRADSGDANASADQSRRLATLLERPRPGTARPARPGPGADLAIVAATAMAAIAGGLAATTLPVIGLIGLVGLGFYAAVVTWPQLAAYAYVAFLPFLAGVPRGQYIPFLRLTEVLQVVLTAALATRFAITLLNGAPIPKPRLSGLDKAFIGFAVFASLVPLTWLALRGLPLTRDDVLSTIPIWKYYGLFLMVRASVKRSDQVRTCLIISVVAACITGLVATFQALDLFGAPALLAMFWAPPGTEAQQLAEGRGSGFLSSSIATASYVTYNLGVAAALLWNDHRSRWFAAGAALVLTVSTFGIGQITGLLSMLVIVFVVAVLSGRLRSLTRTAMAVIPLAVIAVWPVVIGRINETESSTGLPRSWVVRWDNLTTFYLPELGDFNWVLGVRPSSIIAAPETYREEIFLESGYVWLLWVGGVPLLLAFLHFARTLLRRLYGVIEVRSDPVGMAALAAFAAYITIVTLAVLDMHITTRGEADITYVLCALALTAAPAALTRRSVREGLVGSGQLPPRPDLEAGRPGAGGTRP
jgi:putative peptidoglycan lipid II flippase